MKNLVLVLAAGIFVCGAQATTYRSVLCEDPDVEGRTVTLLLENSRYHLGSKLVYRNGEGADKQSGKVVGTRFTSKRATFSAKIGGETNSLEIPITVLNPDQETDYSFTGIFEEGDEVISSADYSCKVIQ